MTMTTTYYVYTHVLSTLPDNKYDKKAAHILLKIARIQIVLERLFAPAFTLARGPPPATGFRAFFSSRFFSSPLTLLGDLPTDFAVAAVPP